MMASSQSHAHLIDRLPAVRGELRADEALSKYTWFKVGGPAEVLFRPADEEDLCLLLAALPAAVPVTVIGNASNLLVRDGGVPGVVIRLGRGFSAIEVEDQQMVVGAGAADLTVARSARDHGIRGLEFLSGIPGTLGGTVRMNGGAYGAEVKDVCTSVRAVDRSGQVHQVAAEDIDFSYRHTRLNAGWIITRATLRGSAGDQETITRRMQEIQSARESSQPVRSLTGGSTFANPDGYKAWQLIERAGCRGLVRGGACISDLHCNFIVNAGTASAADIEGLGEEVRRRVFETSGITLNWEIQIIGVPTPQQIKEIHR
jgi:UDP-N-acetylmuramate dehydrogenase